MPMERPKILTAVTIPTGGWVMKIYIDNAGSFDEALTFTLAAGDYFVAFDHQSDDFIEEFMQKAYTDIVANATSGDYSSADHHGKPVLTLGTDGKINIDVGDTQNMRFAWTEENGASIAAVLGFDSSADDDYTGTRITGDYQHGYGWYADSDGQLKSLFIENHETTIANQSRSLSSQVKTHYIASHSTNEMALQFLSRDQTWSAGTAYGTVPGHPYQPNAAIECWWQEARQGIRFRVYRDGHPSLNAAQTSINRFEYTGNGTDPPPSKTSWEDTSKAFAVSPQELAGKILASTFAGIAIVRRYISSHTATVLTLPNDIHNLQDMTAGESAYWILDQTYETYVVDLNAMQGFAPREIPNIDQYDITIPLLKYQA
jgi:hypothetical protein